MVAAGLDTLPGNINMTIAYLASPRGQEIQKRMHNEIIKSHANEEPWHDCLVEERSEFVVSFVKVCDGSDPLCLEMLTRRRKCFASGPQ